MSLKYLEICEKDKINPHQATTKTPHLAVRSLHLAVAGQLFGFAVCAVGKEIGLGPTNPRVCAYGKAIVGMV
jgi:hypothetical protein